MVQGRLTASAASAVARNRIGIDDASGASRGVLQHLAGTGPLTVSECAKHLARAQSVVSDIVSQLERHGHVARVRDARDRRRALVWLTDEGRARLVEEQEVLSRAALERALARMTPEEHDQLIAGTRALVRAAQPRRDEKEKRR